MMRLVVPLDQQAGEMAWMGCHLVRKNPLWKWLIFLGNSWNFSFLHFEYIKFTPHGEWQMKMLGSFNHW